MIPPAVFIALGLALLFAVALLYAACMMGGMADDALEPYDASPELFAADNAAVAARYAELDDAEYERLRQYTAEMLLTWDEICNLPEVRP